MIVQEDVPYTKEEVKAMVKTIHDLREKLSILGWHPASELPPVDRNGNSKLMVVIDDNGLPNYAYFHSDNLAKFWVKAGDWNMQQPILSVKWWCYPPKED